MNIRENLLRYDTTTTFADYVLDFPNERYYADGVEVSHNKQTGKIDIDTLKPFSIIFLKTDLIPSITNLIKNIKVPFHIISGNSALSPRREDMISISGGNMVSWSGSNLEIIDERFMQVPIGFPGLGKGRPNSYIDIPNIPEEKDINFLMTPLSKDTHGSRNNLPNDSSITILTEKLNYLDYLNFLGKSKYSICPRGFGVDTHRVYESIVMGSIPLVLSSILDNLYSNIGCKILKSWDEIKTLDLNIDSHPDRKVLTIEYWKSKILNHQKQMEEKNDIN